MDQDSLDCSIEEAIEFGGIEGDFLALATAYCQLGRRDRNAPSKANQDVAFAVACIMSANLCGKRIALAEVRSRKEESKELSTIKPKVPR
jgi:hypothetical protein